MNRQSILTKTVILLLLMSGIIMLLVAAAPATSNDLPPRPTAEPTPTPIPEPTPTPAPPVTPDNVGATILLQVADGSRHMWTVVQWQDALGGWHDVVGWRGHLDDGRWFDMEVKMWWVAPADFGTGSFRWQVYSRADGLLLATSEPFMLPTHVNQVVLVPVDITQ